MYFQPVSKAGHSLCASSTSCFSKLVAGRTPSMYIKLTMDKYSYHPHKIFHRQYPDSSGHISTVEKSRKPPRNKIINVYFGGTDSFVRCVCLCVFDGTMGLTNAQHCLLSSRGPEALFESVEPIYRAAGGLQSFCPRSLENMLFKWAHTELTTDRQS